MRTYPFRTPYIITRLFPGLSWKTDSKREKVLYLTFDDGPHPEATPYVLDLLEKYDAKATFFVVGANAEKNPEVLKRIDSLGHQIGNHTYHHLSGWQTSTDIYQNDVSACEATIAGFSGEKGRKVFRPPYGRITPGQIRSLKKEYKIVMWSMLSGDFDPNLNIEAAKRALGLSQSGEVVVFHDSEKSLPNLKQLLPWFLDRFHAKGYKFATLSPLR